VSDGLLYEVFDFPSAEPPVIISVILPKQLFYSRVEISPFIDSSPVSFLLEISRPVTSLLRLFFILLMATAHSSDY